MFAFDKIFTSSGTDKAIFFIDITFKTFYNVNFHSFKFIGMT